MTRHDGSALLLLLTAHAVPRPGCYEGALCATADKGFRSHLLALPEKDVYSQDTRTKSRSAGRASAQSYLSDCCRGEIQEERNKGSCSKRQATCAALLHIATSRVNQTTRDGEGDGIVNARNPCGHETRAIPDSVSSHVPTAGQKFHSSGAALLIGEKRLRGQGEFGSINSSTPSARESRQ